MPCYRMSGLARLARRCRRRPGSKHAFARRRKLLASEPNRTKWQPSLACGVLFIVNYTEPAVVSRPRGLVMLTKPFGLVIALTAALTFLSRIASPASAPIACDANNGGLTLPAGFCALLAADNLGTARHAVVSASGDLYV